MYWDTKMTFTLAYFVSNPVKAEFFFVKDLVVEEGSIAFILHRIHIASWRRPEKR